MKSFKLHLKSPRYGDVTFSFREDMPADIKEELLTTTTYEEYSQRYLYDERIFEKTVKHYYYNECGPTVSWTKGSDSNLNPGFKEEYSYNGKLYSKAQYKQLIFNNKLQDVINE